MKIVPSWGIMEMLSSLSFFFSLEMQKRGSRGTQSPGGGEGAEPPQCKIIAKVSFVDGHEKEINDSLSPTVDIIPDLLGAVHFHCNYTLRPIQRGVASSDCIVSIGGALSF